MGNSTKVEFRLYSLIVANENRSHLYRVHTAIYSTAYSLQPRCKKTQGFMFKIVKIRMIKVCKSCGKEFQNLSEGVLYSSSAIGVLEFCSDNCSKNYLNSVMK
jgi:hypothetical protein